MASSSTQSLLNSVNKKLPICKYGKDCYRKNPLHFSEYRHPHLENKRDSGDDSDLSPSLLDSDPLSMDPIFLPSSSKKLKIDDSNKVSEKEMNPFNLFVTKVVGIASHFNSSDTSIHIRDILSPKFGQLKESAQFNYMFDIDWLVEQYDSNFRKLSLLIVHGCKHASKVALIQEASKYKNIKLCGANLIDPFGTHHTKMMLLHYENGLRVVIHTANLIEGDWYQKTQGVWMSPLLPVQEVNPDVDLSPTHFKTDLLQYLKSYSSTEINYWCKLINRYDFSAVNVFLIASTPGRHFDDNRTKFGHLKLRKVLNQFGPLASNVSSDWAAIAQFSSIGSLGPTPMSWLCTEFLTSLSAVKQESKTLNSSTPLKIIYPTVENVRLSLEGYMAGGSLPYSHNVSQKQPYLPNYMHVWKSDLRGRSRASPHIKSYMRISPKLDKIAWFLLTSANLSKAAWGVLEKNGYQLAIKSYELGILFLPKYFGAFDYFNVSQNGKFSGNGQSEPYSFAIHYDLPLVKYAKEDKPWVVDRTYDELPDTHGSIWELE